MKTNTYKPKIYPATVALTSLFLSIVSPVYAAETWVMEEHDAVITAYYSPQTNQKKYAFGSYNADIIFNGEGVQGADGTQVYPGMMAASGEIPFGARMEVPGLNIVGTVHDRGGRIETGQDGAIRIDLWMGRGEEGLARALQFGMQRHRSKVYIRQNITVPEEKFALTDFPAPQTALNHLPSEAQSLLGTANPQYGDLSIDVTALQNALKNFKYFDHFITTYYGDVTKNALEQFQRDAGIAGEGATADTATREALAAHLELTKNMEEPLTEEDVLLAGQNGKAVRVLQRVLALLGEYHGEINGEYDQELMSIVYKFQIEKGLVASPADTGAGIVGPQTRRAITTAWRQYRINKRGGTEAIVATLGKDWN